MSFEKKKPGKFHFTFIHQESTVTFYRQNDPCSRVSNTQYLEISYS